MSSTVPLPDLYFHWSLYTVAPLFSAGYPLFPINDLLFRSPITDLVWIATVLLGTIADCSLFPNLTAVAQPRVVY